MSAVPPLVAGTPSRQRKGWDIALSIVLLLFTYAAFWLGTLFATLGLAFADDCAAVHCNIELGVGVVFAFGFILALVGFVATIGVIVLLATRHRGWWLAATALGLTVLGWILAFGVYAFAMR